MWRPLPFLALVGFGCAESASSSRPPTNIPAVAPDATVDSEAPDASGSLVAGGDPDASAPRPDRATVDATVDRPADVAPDAPRDATVDRVPDVATDLPRDTGPEEVCGNGIDDDRDGRVDEDCPATSCPTPPPPRTRVWWADGTPPLSALQAAAARGLTLTTDPPDGDPLPAASVIVFARGAPGDEASREALRTWVEGGGAVMTLIVGSGEVDSAECDEPNALVRRFGLSYSCAAPVPWGPITTFLPHPITDGLAAASVPYVNGRGVTERPGVTSAPLVEVDGQVVARAVTPGCGRVIVWGDEHVSFDSYGDLPRRFWEQAFAWLAAAR